MHGIIIAIREKACVHVHHLKISTQEWEWKYWEYMKGEEGVWGRWPPEANRLKRSQIKWMLLLFDGSDFFFF